MLEETWEALIGITYIQGTVRSNGREESVRFLVDSGATYSLLPQPVWRSLTLTPKREMEFVLADGTVIRRAISECYMVLPQGEGHTPVILGEPGDEALLGVVTLEEMGWSSIRSTGHFSKCAGSWCR